MIFRIPKTLFCLLLAALSACSTVEPSLDSSSSLLNAMGMADMPLKELEKLYLNEDSQFMEVDDMAIHYRDIGEGPPVILIHGIMSSLHTWDGWVDELGNSYRMIALDLPGYGMTGSPENPDDFDLPFLLDKFTKFVEYLDLEEERVTLVGNSAGGYLAARYAAEFPDKVERLILIDPLGYPQERPDIFSWLDTPGVKTLAKFVQPPVFVTMSLNDVYGDPKRLSEKNHYRYMHMAQRPGAKALYVRTLELMTETDEEGNPVTLPTPFAGIRAPTLLMWGEEDNWIPIALADEWKKDIQNIQFVSYPGVGHVPMEEIPYQTAQDAMAFLAGLNPEGPSPTTTVDELEELLQGEEFSEGFDGDFGEMEGF